MKELHELVERRFKSDEERIAAARAAISRMCNGDKRWQMCIPPQPDDSDIILGYVVDRYAEAVAAEDARGWGGYS